MWLKEQNDFQCLKGKVFTILQVRATTSFGANIVQRYGDTVIGVPVTRGGKLYGYQVKAKGREFYLSATVGPQCIAIGQIKVKEVNYVAQ